MAKKKIPSWFTKLKTAVSLTVNTIILILLGLGFADSSLILLLIKVISSYIMSMIGIFLGEDTEQSGKKQTKNNLNLLEDESFQDDTVFPTEGGPKGPKNP